MTNDQTFSEISEINFDAMLADTDMELARITGEFNILSELAELASPETTPEQVGHAAHIMAMEIQHQRLVIAFKELRAAYNQLLQTAVNTAFADVETHGTC